MSCNICFLTFLKPSPPSGLSCRNFSSRLRLVLSSSFFPASFCLVFRRFFVFRSVSEFYLLKFFRQFCPCLHIFLLFLLHFGVFVYEFHV